jgi:hypothetical protein
MRYECCTWAKALVPKPRPAENAEDYLLVFRDTAGSRLTLRLRSEAIPYLLEKLKARQ